jgi:hypothetical protein
VILPNPVLVRAFGVDWTVATCFGTSSAGLLVAAVALFVVLAKRAKAVWVPLDPEEASRLAFYGRTSGDPVEPDEVIHGKAVGRGIEIKIDIDGLRKAARRGDWITFWFWPLGLSCAFAAPWFGTVAVFFATEGPAWVLAVVSLFFLGFIGLFWFLPWAALYTNIDLGADDPKRKTG